MTRDEVINEYFEWMCQLVSGRPYFKRETYRKLLSLLHSIDFTYTIEMDGNRADDGINLRYHFGYERGYEDYIIASYLDDRPCSVLEMMVALAKRCEESIMDDPAKGDRTGQWFWGMIENLGIIGCFDRNFDLGTKDYVRDRIDIFLNREYGSNGNGGLFTVNHAKRDLRTVEIWYQLNWYLNEFIGE